MDWRADKMSRLLLVTSIAEAATGVALIVVPFLVGRLLVGQEFSGVAAVVARLAGIALVALGIACLPGGDAARALRGMFAYNALAAVFLLYLGIRGDWVGPVLWPAVALHAVIASLLGRGWLVNLRAGGRDNHATTKGR